MTENEPTDERRVWLRALIARSKPNSSGGGIFAPPPTPSSTNDDNRSK